MAAAEVLPLAVSVAVSAAVWLAVSDSGAIAVAKSEEDALSLSVAEPDADTLSVADSKRRALAVARRLRLGQLSDAVALAVGVAVTTPHTITWEMAWTLPSGATGEP